MPSSFRREAQHQTRGGEWTLNMTSALLATMVALLLSSVTVEGRQVALPGPQCHPSVINSMPQRIRQICKALETIWEFNDTMEDYLDEKDDLINGRATRSMSQFPSALQASSLGSGAGLGDSEVMFRSSRHFPAIHQSAAAGTGLDEDIDTGSGLRPVWSSGVKRTRSAFPARRIRQPPPSTKSANGEDLDHVFLRFGKRGWTSTSEPIDFNERDTNTHLDPSDAYANLTTFEPYTRFPSCCPEEVLHTQMHSTYLFIDNENKI